jgi:hypothetical protein
MHAEAASTPRSAGRLFFPGSWLDTRGVILEQPDPDYVFRALTAEGEAVLRHIEAGPGLARLAELGLIDTTLANEARPAGLPAEFTAVLRHRRIPRIVVPSEWTMRMWQEALAAFCVFNLGLLEAGLCLEDAHANNIVFDPDGRARFVDFGSLKLSRKKFAISRGWHREFKQRFLLPLALNKVGLRALAALARREPRDGFLRRYHHLTPLQAVMIAFDLIYFAAKAAGSERFYFQRIQSLLCRRPVAEEKTNWTDYESGQENLKSRVVPELLDQLADARSVLDLAGNKGAHIRHAARHGRLALLADIDEFSIDCARAIAREERVPMFAARLDLCHPTPPEGLGMFRGGSYERFRSDLVMALAVSHHLAFRLHVPFYTFAAILDRYAEKYILTEFVSLEDVHVRKWLDKGRTPPRGYSESEFAAAFEGIGWRTMKRWADAEGHRVLFLFEKVRS